MLNSDTYVIVPVYNEEQVIGQVINELEQHFSNIICVDDGSTDNSVNVILETSAQLVNHKHNKGQGAAIESGIKHALQVPRAKYFVTFDADGQHRAEDALSMLNHIRDTRVNTVLGSRFLGRSIGIGRIRKQLLRVATTFSNIATGLRLTDTHNGLRVFDRAFAQHLHFTFKGMAHASEILYRIKEGKFTYDEYPVTIIYSDYSKAKGQSSWNALAIAYDMLKYRVTRPWRTEIE